jgi:xanthine dehydrogenase YagR molybdenum-binding subunit
MTDKFMGADAPRIDGADKVLGKALYAADRHLPRTAYALVVTASVGKGRIKRIDTSQAEAVPGVLLVLTHLNMDRLKPLGFLFAGGHGSQSFLPLQSDVIRYRGQMIAIIVAESTEVAQAASSAVRVDYETVPFAVELESEGGEMVTQSIAAPYFPDVSAGDADRARGGAAVSVEAVYRFPAQHHNSMELLSTVAEWQGDLLTLHEGTQAAEALRAGVALVLGMDPDKVRVRSPHAGGGFGQRNSLAPHTVLAAVAARRVQRPVKLVLSREQIFHAVHFRPATRHRVVLGADEKGKLISAVHEVHAQTSRFDLFPFTGAETTSRMYGIPNFRSAVTLVKLDTQTPGFMRAPFEMSSALAFEGAMDELAEKLGLDPVEFRIANDTPTDPITGKPFSLRRLNQCLRRGAQRFGWKRRSALPRSMHDSNGTSIGWGVAAGGYPGYIVPTRATVSLNAAGTAHVSVGGHEMGQGLRTSIALSAAEELGLQPHQIDITIGDTVAPPQHLTAGSWGTASAIPAVQKAARQLRDQLLQLVVSLADSPLHSLQITALALRNGGVESNDGRCVPYAELFRRSGKAELVSSAEVVAPGQKPEALLRAREGRVAAVGPEFPDYVAFSYIAHYVEVRVDAVTRRARVSRVVSVVDCGRVLSRRTARSQLYGGLVWGVGAALSEESEVDPRFGGFLNSNLAEYQVPVNADIGSCEVEFIDEPDLQFNSAGARGLGEVASVGVAAAIANAVYHATGKRIRELPIRIEKLL